MSDTNNDAGTSGNGGGKGSDNVDAQIEAALAKRQAKDIVRDAWDDAYKARERARVAESKIPPEGALVLTGEDAAEWGKFRGLGKFSDVNKALNEGKAATGKLADIESVENYKAVGTAAGMNPVVFARLAKTDGIQFEKKPGKDKDGNPVEQVFVKGEGDALIPIDDYAAAKWPEFLPALKGQQSPPERPRGTPPAFGPPEPRPRPSKADDPYADLPYEHAPPAM